MFNQYTENIGWNQNLQKNKRETWQYVKWVTYYMLIKTEFSETKCYFQMPPAFPSDTFMLPASDENWKTACRNDQELSGQSNPLPCIFWSLKNTGSSHLAWLFVVLLLLTLWCLVFSCFSLWHRHNNLRGVKLQIT